MIAKPYQVEQVLLAIEKLEDDHVFENDRYTYRVTWSEDDTKCVGIIAEFPSLSWLTKTPEAPLKGI